VYNPKTLQSTTNNKSVLNVRHAISIDERRAFFRQNLWGNKFEKDQDIKQVWFAGVHCDVGGSYTPDKSALSNIALEWMLVEAMDKALIINREEARKQVKGIGFASPHLEKMNQSLKGVWYIAEIWPKIIRKNLVARKQVQAVKENKEIPKDKWVSRLYFNLGRPRLLPGYGKHALHESVVWRLQQLDSYRPENLVKICGKEIKSIAEKFRIEKWTRL